MGREDSSEILQLEGEASPAMIRLKLNLKMIEGTEENCDYSEIEEPVSPPACDPEEGPPLLCSQSIEDIASEVVDENRVFNNIIKRNTAEAYNGNIPKTIVLADRNSFPSLIPVTVSEMSEDPLPYQNPPTLHMSGGMVSTDMTLHMASVPTSVITTNTSIEHKLEQDEGIDRILQYFICGPVDDHVNLKAPDNQIKTGKVKDKYPNNNPQNPSTYPKPLEMSPNLPLDLSVARIPAGSRLESKGVDGEGLSGWGKRQREKMPDEGQEVCAAKKSFGISRTDIIVDEKKKSNEMQHKGKLKQDQLADTMQENLSSNSQVANKSNMKSIHLKEGAKVSEEKPTIEASKVENDIDCRLVLPGRKEEKARIVFTNGLYVEIDREVFRSLEQKILKEKPKCQKDPKMTLQSAKNITTDFRRKKAISRKKSEKHNSIDVQKPIQNKMILDQRQTTKSTENKEDRKPKDMPMIVTNDNGDDEEKHKPSKQTEVQDKQPKAIQMVKLDMTLPPIPSPSTPPPSPATPITPPPSPPSLSNPSSPPGLHKLPSIVSKPSFYAKCETRKVLKVK